MEFCGTMQKNQKDGTWRMFRIFNKMKEWGLLNEIMDQILVSKDLMQCVLHLLGDEKSIWLQ